jgi:hypothetical protein
MSTSAVSSTSLNQQLQQYFQTRQSDLQQLGQSLSSGNLTAAQAQFNNITALGESGPFAGGNAFKITGRQDDFNALGQALQSGDLAGAQQAFGALASTFKNGGAQNDPPTTSPASSSSVGPEIVLNLSNTGSSSNPEQITINIANAASGGGEQVSLSVGNQGSSPQQVTFNLAANSNEQIVLNLLSASSAGSAASTSTAGGGLSVSA